MRKISPFASQTPVFFDKKPHRLLIATMLLLQLVFLTMCSPGERACTSFEDCKISAPKLQCIRGFCSEDECSAGETKTCYDADSGTKKLGQCKEGFRICLNTAKWSTCFEQQTPIAEICDKDDNDCDGKVDEGLDCQCKAGERQECYTGPPKTVGQGSCSKGLQYCDPDNKWGHCLGQIKPAAEVCDKLDNNCDGQIDEGLSCECESGAQRPCYGGPKDTQGNPDDPKNPRPCRAGVQYCEKNKQWGTCLGQILPQKEICDGKDNDCNGQIDEGCECSPPGQKDSCYEGPPNTAAVGTCKEGFKVCNEKGVWGTCLGQLLPTTERCNGEDDDCNGKTDETFPEKDASCQIPSLKGPCQWGKNTCVNGKLSCLPTVKPQPQETCGNLIDDDCNGLIDEIPPCLCKPGQTRPCYNETKGCTLNPDKTYTCQGTCRTGSQLCEEDQTWGSCVGAIPPTTELCKDNKDNNCDGQIDENCP